MWREIDAWLHRAPHPLRNCIQASLPLWCLYNRSFIHLQKFMYCKQLGKVIVWQDSKSSVWPPNTTWKTAALRYGQLIWHELTLPVRIHSRVFDGLTTKYWQVAGRWGLLWWWHSTWDTEAIKPAWNPEAGITPLLCLLTPSADPAEICTPRCSSNAEIWSHRWQKVVGHCWKYSAFKLNATTRYNLWTDCHAWQLFQHKYHRAHQCLWGLSLPLQGP